MSFKRILAAVIVLIATLGTATSASASTPSLGPAPVPDVKWIERPCFDWIVPFDDELPCGEAYHNTKAAALGVGHETEPHVPRP